MKKVFTFAPGESWIVDRFVEEWYYDNADISARSLDDADVVWVFADWCFRSLPKSIFRSSKKIIVTVHHVVPEKFDHRHREQFIERDNVVHAYHVPNVHTLNFVSQLTKKPIYVVPYWANGKIWRPTASRVELREKYDLPLNAFLIGSFQRDTEGSDLVTPKLEKGPDLLADAIVEYAKRRYVEVVLAGWRRQYIIKRLDKAGIKYTYFDRPAQSVVNDLYQTLDLYPVTARYEGGPQSLIECGLLNVPVVSRDIGMASVVLPSAAIDDNVCNAVPHVPNVENLRIPNGYMPFRKIFTETIFQ